MNGYIGGYRIDLEDKDGLLATETPASRLLRVGDTPERVDPRKSPLAADGWLPVENQGAIGSCAGNALSECLEYCYGLMAGKALAISRYHAYVAAQLKDSIRGDKGSTLSGGTKAALDGICRESIGPYPSRYISPESYITPEIKADAPNFRMRSHTSIKSADHGREFIGSGVGIIQIGISWGNEMTPDRNGCIRLFTGSGGGGHSVALAGYIPDSDAGQRSSVGWWFLLKNSWGTSWSPSLRGYAYLDPAAFNQMLRHRFTVAYGRSDLETPSVRDIPHDFTAPGKGIRV
jgi:hypothetical protein